MTEEEKKLLAAAQQVCLKYGYVPLPKATIKSMVSTYDVVEAAFDGVSRLKPGFQGLVEGKTITKEAAARNLQAIETLEQIAAEQKPIYAQIRAAMKEIFQHMGDE